MPFRGEKMNLPAKVENGFEWNEALGGVMMQTSRSPWQESLALEMKMGGGRLTPLSASIISRHWQEVKASKKSDDKSLPLFGSTF